MSRHADNVFSEQPLEERDVYLPPCSIRTEESQWGVLPRKWFMVGDGGILNVFFTSDVRETRGRVLEIFQEYCGAQAETMGPPKSMADSEEKKPRFSLDDVEPLPTRAVSAAGDLEQVVLPEGRINLVVGSMEGPRDLRDLQLIARAVEAESDICLVVVRADAAIPTTTMLNQLGRFAERCVVLPAGDSLLSGLCHVIQILGDGIYGHILACFDLDDLVTILGAGRCFYLGRGHESGEAGPSAMVQALNMLRQQGVTPALSRAVLVHTAMPTDTTLAEVTTVHEELTHVISEDAHVGFMPEMSRRMSNLAVRVLMDCPPQ